MTRVNKNYSKDIKVAVVKKYKEGGMSIQEVADLFQVSSKTQVHSWIKKYEKEGEDAFSYEKRGNPSEPRKVKERVEDLKFLSIEQEVEFLRIENEYLKRLCEQLRIQR
ncbi:MAG: transposase [Cetobacterium sp.]